MFPTNWNDPYRKKDGTLVNMEELGDGGGGGSELPDYSQADAGKVLTVGEDGELEWNESGAGGGDAFLSYDFTKLGNFTIRDLVISEDGANFNASDDYFMLIDYNYKKSNITLYIDTGDFVITPGQAHQRFVISSNAYTCGLIWRYTENVWSVYDGNQWCASEITDLSFFDNCTLKIYIDADDYWHVYKNNTLVLESNRAINPYSIYLGSPQGQSISAGFVKAVRIYSGNYTE